jgi:hypothetical protein
MLTVVALVGTALVLTAPGAVAEAPLYSLAATQSCLTGLPSGIAGLPPARPPAPPALFVDALARHEVSPPGVGQRSRAHGQLAVWAGRERYEGIILSLFASILDARPSSKSGAWLYGGERVRNVVVTWAQQSAPSRNVRNTVVGCLRSKAAGGPAPSQRAAPKAKLATFAGRWGGHTRGLSITSSGKGHESADDGCCTRVYELTFRIVSVSGTLTHAVAVYRVTSFRRYEREVRPLRVGDVGKLLLRNGIVTNTLTRDFFCSDPAWDATGACGA